MLSQGKCPLPQVKASGGKQQHNDFLLTDCGLAHQDFPLHISPWELSKWTLYVSSNSHCQVLPRLHCASDQQNTEECVWFGFFSACNSKTYHIKLQLHFVKRYVLVQFIASFLPRLRFSQGLKGTRGLIFQRCLSGM